MCPCRSYGRLGRYYIDVLYRCHTTWQVDFNYLAPDWSLGGLVLLFGAVFDAFLWLLRLWREMCFYNRVDFEVGWLVYVAIQLSATRQPSSRQSHSLTFCLSLLISAFPLVFFPLCLLLFCPRLEHISSPDSSGCYFRPGLGGVEVPICIVVFESPPRHGCFLI